MHSEVFDTEREDELFERILTEGKLHGATSYVNDYLLMLSIGSARALPRVIWDAQSRLVDVAQAMYRVEFTDKY